MVVQPSSPPAHRAARRAPVLAAVMLFTTMIAAPELLAAYSPVLQGWPANAVRIVFAALLIGLLAWCWRAPAAGRAQGLPRGWQRALWAVMGAFVLIGANAMVQAWQARQLEEARSVAAEVVEAAGQQSRLTQRLGRLAALMALRPEALADNASLMAGELAQSHADALRVDALMAPAVQRAAADGPGAARSFDAWQTARERLWYRASGMLRHADQGRHDLLREAADGVQVEADRAANAAQALVMALGDAARREQRAGLDMARFGGAITLLLLAVLAFSVVAPAVRAAQAQAARLSDQLRENERLALVAEHTGNLVMITDRERRILWANKAFTRQTGYELHETVGRTPGELLRSELTDISTVTRLRSAVEEGCALRVELLCRSKDGRDYWIDTDMQPLHDAQGALTGFIVVETVITEQVTQRLRTSALLSALPTAVVVHDHEGGVTDVNPAARKLLGVRPGDDAQHLARLEPVHEDHTPWAGSDLPAAQALREGSALRGQVIGIASPEGDRRWLHVNTQPLADAVGAAAGVVACYVDISDRRRLLEQLRESARSDPLTRLPNRTVVLERVQRAIEHRKRHPEYGFAVLFMDVDRFKQVNDTLGHNAGDELLRQVSERLVATLRPGDAVARIGGDPAAPGASLHTAARIGGDEFVIVLEGVRVIDDACVVAQRLLEELAEPYTVAAHPVHASVSIGIVGADHAGDSADAVLRDCDTAMYEAKRAGRGRYVVFDASMHDRVVNALQVEQDLRLALERNELFVVYQPVVELGSGTLAAAEALVRWQHPVRGLVPPGQFIGVAEECGLIDAIGATVLRLACEQFALWQRELGERAPPMVSVNLSRAQLKVPTLVSEVAGVLKANRMQPAQLQFEVTESLAAQDQRVQSTLRELKTLGIKLALDDFGTGYSSLACLHQLPVDTVKIDRSFVAHARDVEYHRVLIEATIRVARTLGMTTVAEGIELDDQAAMMESLRCDRGQGYLFGRPMTAADFAAWTERSSADTVS